MLWATLSNLVIGSTFVGSAFVGTVPGGHFALLAFAERGAPQSFAAVLPRFALHAIETLGAATAGHRGAPRSRPNPPLANPPLGNYLQKVKIPKNIKNTKILNSTNI